MITRYGVQCGHDNYPIKLELNKDTVYRRSNIQEYTDSNGQLGYKYDEDEITLLEYFRDVVPQNEDTLGELSILLANYQQQIDQTIAELSILIGGQNNV